MLRIAAVSLKDGLINLIIPLPLILFFLGGGVGVEEIFLIMSQISLK